MRFKYSRNTLMATCISLALSQAYAMENLVNNSSHVVKKASTDRAHSTANWNIEKRENYTKKTYVNINEYDHSTGKNNFREKPFEERFLKSIEFKPKNYYMTPTGALLQDSLFVGEKQDQDGNNSFVILVHGQDISSYISTQVDENATNLEIKRKIDKKVFKWKESLIIKELGYGFYNKTDEERRKIREKYAPTEKELKEHLSSLVKGLRLTYEKGLSGGTDIERAFGPNPREEGTKKYSYRYPFRYSHQSQNPTDSVKFLAKFYQWRLIPDFFIDEIVAFIGIKDCRIPSSFIDEPVKVNNSHRENESRGTIITEQNTSTPAQLELRTDEELPQRQEVKTLPVQLELIPDEELLQRQEVKTLPAQVEEDVPVVNPSEMTIAQRYFPQILQLLAETNEDARHARTRIANIIIGNGVAGNALQDFSLSEQTLLDLLRVGMVKERRIQELEAQLKKSSTTPTLTHSQEEKELALTPTAAAQSVTKGSHGTTVVTDNNGNASYQLESAPFNVTGGQKIKVHYDITVEADGVMSLGLLNTGRNGWYGDELVLRAGSHGGSFERVVPSDETKTSLVFRNYRGILDQSPGQTTFTIKKISVDY